MALQRDVPAIDERFETILAHAVTQVKTEEDPLVLNKYKKLFKKNVPLTLRSYVAAYLVKQLACGDSLSNVHTGGKGAAKAPVRFGRSQYTGEPSERFDREKRKTFKKDTLSPPAPRIVIDPAEATAIFISIGRNRGVFPRDLIALICQSAALERERIGEIRVLDNYSFVQVYAEDAEKIIAALNGSDYRNRKLTVSHSRKKEDGAPQENADTASDSEAV